MTKLRVHNIAVSLDGFATGEGQSLETPFGHAGQRLMDWFFPTHAFVDALGHAAESKGTGTRGVDDAFAAASWQGIGAEIMGRRKFGPQQGPWEDESWRGWWGEEPPFRTPVVVLTHHARPDITVGETTFLFRELSPADALALASHHAGGLDVRLGGGPTVVREFLDADLVDHLHIVVVPIILGRGVRLWDGLESLETRFDIEVTASPSGVVHYVWTRSAGNRDSVRD
ncbi:dihydrofolate reductase family protein [Microbacterium ulmi]|uniref:Dihydrofolate reductase n=1 Tax=Microbacterium ulmi TaxID=179095 RepID=A0A7Y2LZE0_9MICO|nr:dihydrofolate reductase family protein [Microbacterium ulmi]NII70907.1 dihydrofolate reductase [Microbacterium ulmi]NNH02919.1 dihydrofolate reductase [Microbacterium ulmi]